MNSFELVFFSGFIIFIIGFLLLDLGVFDKRNHLVSFPNALFYTCLWIAVSLLFYLFLRYHGELIHLGEDGNIDLLKELVKRYGHPIKIDNLSYESALAIYRKNLALEFLSGYIIEKMLSVDNIFVMIVIFYAFKVNPLYYRRVLFYGILAAIVFRFIFIFSASALIQNFHWILYIFGLILIYTGIKMTLTSETVNINVKDHPVVRLASRYFPIYPKFVRHHFFVRKGGKLLLTPLFIVLMVIEFSDVVFAIDSIPAIFAITNDPYIIFFSNIFAVLGLRAMFFILIRVMDFFRFLKVGLAVLLIFIGAKMLVAHYLKSIGFTTVHSLWIILSILFISIVLSLIFPEKKSE